MALSQGWRTNFEFPQRMPVVWTVLFAVVGILFDCVCPWPAGAWLSVAILLLLYGLLLSSRGVRGSALWVLIGTGFVFAAWHHARWNHYASDEIGLQVGERSTPIILRGTVAGHVSHITMRPGGLTTIPGGPISRFQMRVVQVRDGFHWRAASGLCNVIVKGRAEGLAAGDRLKIVGKIQRPADRLHPSGYSRFERMRVERSLCRLVTNHTECVVVERRASAIDARYWMAWYRSRAIDDLLSYLGQDRGELAAALLLGAREYVDPARVDAFFLTGTIHLLAISGLHVGILAWGLFLLVRSSLVPRRWSLVLIMLLTVAYAALTGGRAPVTRATILVILVCGQLLLHRRAVTFNGLAVAALAVLVWNPMQLYQVGAQLSFLAVASIIWVRPWLNPTTTDPLARLIQRHESWWQSARRSLLLKLRAIAIVSFVVWATTLPLVMYRFHLVAPSALVLNLFLWVPIGLALFLGFGVLLFANVWPWLASLFACGCSACLASMESAVQLSCSVEGSHFWTAGPGLIAVCGFYTLLVCGASLPKMRRQIRWWAPLAAMLIAISTYANSRPTNSSELRCAFLPLRYGTCVVITLPSGGVWLYDAGSLGSPTSAVREIASFLWSHGVSTLSGIIVSHPDADHYNAVPGLLDRFAVRSICTSPGMSASDSDLPEEMQACLFEHHQQIKVLERGNEWFADEHTRFRVLHPRANSLHSDDNANSVVLLIEYDGRSILLPGDVEREGLIELMEQSTVDCDIVLAPHHGSRFAMPHEFCKWCRPEHVVISGGQAHRADEIVRRYDNLGAKVLHTALDGLVNVTVRGRVVSVATWKED